MSPDHVRLSMPSIKSQQGSMLVIAIFIIVVLGLLLSALANILNSSQQSVNYEVLGVRAQAAANAGMEAGLYRVLRESVSCNVMPAGSTTPTTSLSVNLDASLAQCTVTVLCGQRSAINSNSANYYILHSSGSCSAGDNKLTVTRNLKAEVQR